MGRRPRVEGSDDGRKRERKWKEFRSVLYTSVLAPMMTVITLHCKHMLIKNLKINQKVENERFWIPERSKHLESSPSHHRAWLPKLNMCQGIWLYQVCPELNSHKCIQIHEYSRPTLFLGTSNTSAWMTNICAHQNCNCVLSSTLQSLKHQKACPSFFFS